MARPREFDDEDVLRKAGAQFWSRGYQATSIRDIATATGVRPGSLYKAFGDKKALFLKCVEQYMSTLSYKAMLLADFDRPIKDSLGMIFDTITESSADEDRISGCLVTNAAFELAIVAPDIAAELKRCLGEVERAIRFRLEWAKETGEIGEDRDIDALTAYYTVILQGLLMSSRVTKDRDAMKRAGAIALGLLD